MGSCVCGDANTAAHLYAGACGHWGLDWGPPNASRDHTRNHMLVSDPHVAVEGVCMTVIGAGAAKSEQ